MREARGVSASAHITPVSNIGRKSIIFICVALV